MVTLGASDSRERAIADAQFGSGSPANWYFGLSTTTPADDGSGFTEPSGNAYARVTVVNNSTNFPAASTTGGVTTKSNGTAITFPNPTGNWGAITYAGVFTASSGGTPEYTFALLTTITPKSGNTPVQFDIGGLVMEWQ